MTRTGLVLGAGGILGSAWMTGALPAVQERIGRPLGELDLVLGTSAGAVLGAALRCGMGVDELLAHQRGTTSELPDMRTIERETGELVTVLQTRLGVTGDGWVPGAPLWVVAVDYDSGRRAVFGRPGGPPSTVGEAVLASCSIPGWFAPQVIDGHRYVDGGVASSTSLGLLARPGAPQLDEVYVLAPLASHEYDRPLDPIAGVERGVRCLLTRWLDAEVRAVRAAGVRVTVLTPGAADLAAMGGNMMNPRRRARVLDVALRTSATALETAVDEGARAA